MIEPEVNAYDTYWLVAYAEGNSRKNKPLKNKHPLDWAIPERNIILLNFWEITEDQYNSWPR